MALIHEPDIKKAELTDVARKMVLAARTAPKGRGADTIIMKIVDAPEIKEISAKLKSLGKTFDLPAFARDAESILSAPVMVLMGTTIKPVGLKKCGMCGFRDCAEKDRYKNIPCVFNTGDLGIALGSAVGVAMDHRVDNRIMYTVGQAVMDMGILGADVKVAYAVPLSATSKNPFFDR